ncbi:MAG TPA: carbon monoxide dehydrogenase subunit G [Actinomycetales bacterium]|nr:carbon monoxide dehydrogenase subunit G [Actinomycetales bacterium]
MKVTGTASLSAAPDRVFAALNDPNVLVATIPGVQSLEQVDENRYRMSIVAGVASIKGTYEGEVVLSDQNAPHSFTLKAKGAGAPGTVDATVQVKLSENGGGTHLEYDADAVVGGMVGGVGQRMLTGVSKKMAGQFFGNVDSVLTSGLPAAPAAAEVAGAAPAGVGAAAAPPEAVGAAAPAVAGAGQVFRAPSAARAGGAEDLRVPFWVMLAGVGAGAFWALAGVLVGWRIARRSGD